MKSRMQLRIIGLVLKKKALICHFPISYALLLLRSCFSSSPMSCLFPSWVCDLKHDGVHWMHRIDSLSFAIFFAPVNSLASTQFTLTRRDSEAAVAKLINAIPGCFVSGDSFTL